MENDDRSQMVFAEVQYPEEPADVHSEMVAAIRDRFSNVESGLQSDSWIWIMDGEEKVAVDSFTSMKHQVKSYSIGPLVQKVIDTLRGKYVVRVLDKPTDMWD